MGKQKVPSAVRKFLLKNLAKARAAKKKKSSARKAQIKQINKLGVSELRLKLDAAQKLMDEVEAGQRQLALD